MSLNCKAEVRWVFPSLDRLYHSIIWIRLLLKMKKLCLLSTFLESYVKCHDVQSERRVKKGRGKSRWNVFLYINLCHNWQFFVKCVCFLLLSIKKSVSTKSSRPSSSVEPISCHRYLKQSHFYFLWNSAERLGKRTQKMNKTSWDSM